MFFMTIKFVALISVVGLGIFCVVQAQSPAPSESPPRHPGRPRKLHRPQPPARQPLRPEDTPLRRNARLRGNRVRLPAQCPRGARLRKPPIHLRRADVIVMYGLTPRQVFITGKARVFTARRERANT